MDPAEVARIQGLITEAEAEYHALMTGLKPRVVVDQNGERVEFSQANGALLAGYIRDLKRMLPGTVVPQYTAPLRFIF